MTVTEPPPTAFEVIMENLPVDDDDGYAFVGVNPASGAGLFGPPEQVAVKIRDALRDAGLLVATDDEPW